METFIKNTASGNLINLKAKLFFAFLFCIAALFLLSVYLIIAWKGGTWTVPFFLVNFGENAFFIFKAILTLFRLQLVFPTLFELSLDLSLFENLKNFL